MSRVFSAIGWILLSLVLLSTSLPPASLVHAVAVGGGAGGEASGQPSEELPEAGPPGTWMTPVPGFQVVKAFDKPEENWLAGHRGIDVLALPGEPVRAPAFGTVRFAGSVAGAKVVSLNIGVYVMSYQSVDTDLKKGDAVTPGMHFATVSDPSHCSKGCVHVGVWRSDKAKDYLNPVDFFSAEASVLLPSAQAPDKAVPVGGGSGSGKGAGPWGGHQNGRIPVTALCPVKSAPGHTLRCDAASAFDRMSAAYEQTFGRPISVTDSYRTYQQQVVLKKRKGRMAATPGKSNHGWGLAVDLGGGINSFGTAQHRWMRANAPKFGWVHPAWARSNGSLPEPWHWEFTG